MNTSSIDNIDNMNNMYNMDNIDDIENIDFECKTIHPLLLQQHQQHQPLQQVLLHQQQPKTFSSII